MSIPNPPKVEFTEYHRVYYFYFSESRELMYFLILAMYDEIDTKFDKLWLLVDERTGIVEDYFFKEGIRPLLTPAGVAPADRGHKKRTPHL